MELIRPLLQLLQIKFEYFILFTSDLLAAPGGHDMTHWIISKYRITTTTGISSEFSENVKNPVSQQPDAMTPIRKSYFYHRVQDVNYYKTESSSLLTSQPLF